MLKLSHKTTLMKPRIYVSFNFLQNWVQGTLLPWYRIEVCESNRNLSQGYGRHLIETWSFAKYLLIIALTSTDRQTGWLLHILFVKLGIRVSDINYIVRFMIFLSTFPTTVSLSHIIGLFPTTVSLSHSIRLFPTTVSLSHSIGLFTYKFSVIARKISPSRNR